MLIHSFTHFILLFTAQRSRIYFILFASAQSTWKIKQEAFALPLPPLAEHKHRRHRNQAYLLFPQRHDAVLRLLPTVLCAGRHLPCRWRRPNRMVWTYACAQQPRLLSTVPTASLWRRRPARFWRPPWPITYFVSRRGQYVSSYVRDIWCYLEP